MDRLLTRTVVTPLLSVPTGSPYTFHVGAKLSVDLEPGDYVQMWSHVQGTNDLGYNCMFARYLKESSTSNKLHTEGTLIATPMGINITPDAHHGMLEAQGDFLATESRTHNFLVCVYAASTAADPGDKLWLHYAEFAAVVWR